MLLSQQRLGLSHLNQLEIVMGTYQEMREHGRKRYGRPVIQTCWIADRKEANGVLVNSRRTGARVKPCPPKYAALVDNVLRDFGVLNEVRE